MKKEDKVKRNYIIATIVMVLIIISEFTLVGITATYDMLGNDNPYLGIFTIWGLLFMFACIPVWSLFYGRANEYGVSGF
ncbi:MAG: hypothetical protein ACW98X_26550 [Promethearchaeota archaeon]|jgi:hypothetical protein